MGRRIALLSGGKDSFYAALHHWPPDLGLVLVYKFPEPSPHLVNLGKTVETLTAAGIPVVVYRLPYGKEKHATVSLLRRLDADEIIAGDVYIEDHLRYMESVAADAGAKLREPLWGRDPREVLLEIVESGIRAVVTGVRGIPSKILGTELNKHTVHQLLEEAERGGWDPLGERGEYHTLIIDSPKHSYQVGFIECRKITSGSVTVLQVC